MLQQKIEREANALHGDTAQFRQALQPEAILSRMCRSAEHVATRERRPVWSVIGEWTGHGSGVSAAIYGIYRDRDE